MTEMTPQKAAARRILESQFERLGERYLANADERFQILQERREAEEMWRLAGFGEPPKFVARKPAELAEASA